jgi:hypothetical protein
MSHMARAEQYAVQMAKMKAAADAWRKAHPTDEVLVQFNFPREAYVIAPISDAFTAGVVTANAKGLELIKALWPWDDTYEPTVMMVRAILESEDHPLVKAAENAPFWNRPL